MILQVNRVQANDVRTYVWKRLRYFLSEGLTIARIKEIHNIQGDQHDTNIRKQASQIAFCIRQAEEYFRAASTASSATKPVMLYYGASSLGSALFLLNKTGDYCLDQLQLKNKHHHHGLETKSFTSIRSHDSPIDILDKIVATTFFKNEIEPWGHFYLFYSSLSPSAVSIKKTVTSDRTSGTLEGYETLNCINLASFDSFKDRNFSASKLIATLPDLIEDFKLLGGKSALFRGQAKLDVKLSYTAAADQPETETADRNYVFTVNGITASEQEKYLKTLKDAKCQFTSIQSFTNHLSISCKQQLIGGICQISPEYLPDLVDDIYGQLYVIPEPLEYMPEPASYHTILFTLSMLARYQPHIWMSLLDSNIHFAEFLSSLLSIAERKFPLLILDQLTKTKHLVE